MRAASLFPNWVRLTSKVDNIAAWREVDVNAARSTFLESRSTVSTGPSGTLQPAKLVAWFVIFFVGILLFALLQAKDGFVSSFVDLDVMNGLIARHRAGTEDATDRIWRLLNLQIWGDVYITGNREQWQDGLMAASSAI